MSKIHDKTRNLVITALFLAIAIALSMFESLLPPLPTPIPMRYGLANVAVMAALLYLPLASAWTINIGKSLFVFLTRGLLAGLTSLSGSILALLSMMLLLKIRKKDLSLFIMSITGAIFHNLGQFLIFLLISKVDIKWNYLLALLIIPAVITGTISSLILKAVQRPLESWFEQTARSIAIIFLIILLLPLAFTSLACNSASKRHEALTTKYFDTVCQLIVFTENKEEFDHLEDIFINRLEDLDSKFNIYSDAKDEENNVKTLNQYAGQKKVLLDEDTINLLDYGKKAYEYSLGKVNIMCGAVTSLWHDAREFSLENPKNARLPNDGALKQAAEHCSIDDLLINHSDNSAYIKDPLARVDVGAIAKGYALDLLVKDLQASGAENFLLNMGGNIHASGMNLDKDKNWSIGVKNPNVEEEEKIIDVINLQDCSVATSGFYERVFEYEGKSYHHIIDPDTLYPADNYKSVTVITKEGVWSDILSTALFLSDPDEVDLIAKNFADLAVLFVNLENEQVSFGNWNEYQVAD